MDFDRNLLLPVFRAESEEGLSAMEQSLVALETNPSDAELIATIFRHAHTLKGNAGSMGYDTLGAFAHAVEELLDLLREGALRPSPAIVSVLLRAVDALQALLASGIAGSEGLTSEQQGLLASLVAIAGGRARIDAEVPADSPAPALAEPTSLASFAQDDERQRALTLRVGVEKLDRLLDLIGEIAVSRGRLLTDLEALGKPAFEVLEAEREHQRVYDQLRELMMQARMVSVGPTFRTLARTVRDLALAHGKQARLELVGEDTEVDLTIVEQLRDPLLHLIRNAIDHGIEAPELRVARGKPAVGTLTLQAAHEAGAVVLRISDDGAGLDRQRILARGRERGLLTSGSEPADLDLFRLIFEPGFSTAEAITNLSGRGVGMDVVRRNVEALRGSVSVASVAGRGTAFTIRLPLTLAIIDGFGVSVADEEFILPIESVLECLELPEEELRHDRARGVVQLRGDALPYLRLRHHFEVPGPAPQREHLVVVRHEEGRAGIVVQALLGQIQSVIKPLGPWCGALRGIVGSSIQGSGRVALIVDVPGLVRHALEQAAEE